MFSSVGVSGGGAVGGFHERSFVEYAGCQGEGTRPVQGVRSVVDRDNFVRLWVARFGSEGGDGVLNVCRCWVFRWRCRGQFS